MEDTTEKRRNFSYECISCNKLFDCKGKPENVKDCIEYEQREGHSNNRKTD